MQAYDVLFCNALRADCSVEWTAVAAIGSLLAALATSVAAFSAWFAARSALEIETRAAKREEERRMHDSIPITAAIRRELEIAIVAASRLENFPGILWDDEIVDVLTEAMAMCSLSLTSSSIRNLGYLHDKVGSEAVRAVANVAVESRIFVVHISEARKYAEKRIASGKDFRGEEFRFLNTKASLHCQLLLEAASKLPSSDTSD